MNNITDKVDEIINGKLGHLMSKVKIPGFG